MGFIVFFFFKQKTAYEIMPSLVGSEMCIRDRRRDDGDVWDHYDVYFEYDHNVAAHISCRQWVGCHGEIVDRTVCEKGMLVTPYRPHIQADKRWRFRGERGNMLSLIHISEPTRLGMISYAVFCLKKKKKARTRMPSSRRVVA